MDCCVPLFHSDNGSPFTSREFQQYCSMNGIKHIRSSPFHPASNGLAERAVQTIKGGLKKMGGDLETRMFEFLGRYRITPQTTTGESPAQMLMSKTPRVRLDLLLPGRENRVRATIARESAGKSQFSCARTDVLCRRHCLGNELCSSSTEVATRCFATMRGPGNLHSWPNRWSRVETTHRSPSGTAARGECHDDIAKTAREYCSTCESYSTCERRYRGSGDGETTTRSVIV